MSLLTGGVIVQGDFVTTSAGAGSSGKVAKLNGSGQIDVSFLPFAGAFRSGTTTHDISSTTTQNIAHGLGAVPKMVTIKSLFNNGPTSGSGSSSIVFSMAETVYANGTQSSYSMGISTGDSANSFGKISNTFHITAGWPGGTEVYCEGVVTVDATNIIIAWTKFVSPTGSASLLWTAVT